MLRKDRPAPLAFALALGLLAWWTSFPCLLAHCLASGATMGTATCGLGLEHLDRADAEQGKAHCGCGHCKRPAQADAPAVPASGGDEEPCRCPCTVFGGCKRDLPPALCAVRLPPAALALALPVPPATPLLLPAPEDATAPLAVRHACDPPRVGPLAGLSLRL